MQRSWDEELPDCCYDQKQPSLIKPSSPTPNHMLCLSNLDDQKFLRFSIKYLYLFQKSVPINQLKYSLSRVLVDYYPLAGRLKTLQSSHQLDDHDDDDDDTDKLMIDCNGEGAVFAEACIDMSAHEFLQVSKKPNKSWRKLLFKVDVSDFVDTPPLVVQVTKLRCGGMILCTAINHCFCDGIGTSQFLHAWTHLTTKPTDSLPITPFHSRHVFNPRSPSSHAPRVHPAYTKNAPNQTITFGLTLNDYLQSQPLVPASLTYTGSNILTLKSQCVPSMKCTTFEILASHTWRSWARSLNLAPSLDGMPLHMGPLTSDIYCLFLPVVGDSNADRVLVSLPKSVVSKFEYYMNKFLDPNDIVVAK
ncbi:hypothetical protein E3N88_25712 [Mikania micrantha]|uniref:Omega-hydroxypalmitate O-feruloyl transferase n=1 Tax=Mikania micrantha TaxID=192012 RepID=A0A5N6N5N8_9ASTR|nr:hypothetical protein E3N88_25712 [Mikania micrantha]